MDTPLAGIYGFGEPGRLIEVHSGNIELVGNGSAPGRVWMTLDGDVDVRWEVDLPQHVGLGQHVVRLKRPDLGEVEVPAWVTRSSGSGDIRGASLTSASSLRHVVAHWVNLPQIFPAAWLADDGHRWAGRWQCDAAGWSLTLDSRPDLSDIVQELRSSRRFALTHIAELRRTDNAAFTSEEAGEALFGFQLAFSFALGRWVAPSLPVGFDDAGRRAWEQWAPWRCDKYGGFHGWWDAHAGDALADFVRRFLRAWSDPGEHDLVRHVAFHAITANHAGTTLEARIMLAQAGLEYLAWVTSVLSGQMTGAQFKNRSAHEHIRALLANASIPADVPADLPELSQFAAKEGFDGPQALVWARNRLVHPKDAGEPYRIHNLVLHAWQLSMHYAQLLLLHRLGYRGPYAPPFPPGRFAHDSEAVPWA